jgi:Domain of unknown function (DUF4276)
MKFVVFVEGYTEKKALPDFLKRWLDPRLSERVGIQIVRFDGWAEYVKDVPKKALLHLNGPKQADIIALIGLLDLYGPTFYPAGKRTADERYAWAKADIEGKVSHPKFRHHFAVHECEAWLLSAPDGFPADVKRALPGRCAQPEQVNFSEPPKKLLERLYRDKTGGTYKQVTHGAELFGELDPEVAYAKCPYLRALLDEMLALAGKAGLKRVVVI